jgi:hypothetical protein
MFIGIGMGLTGQAPPFSPSSLFLASEQGAWYDPSCLECMFQDSAGTTAAALNSPVGLLLDKRYGLVTTEEKVGDAGFDNAGYWAADAGWVVAGGVATGTAVTGGISKASALTVGNWYRATLTVARTSGSLNLPYDGAGSNISAVSTSGTFTRYFRATTTTLQAVYSTAFTGTIDNISVKEVPGNHATQATAASRPTLKQDASGRLYLEFDGIDDSLATAAINFTATDKMTVVAGVHKASDAAVGAAFGTYINTSTAGTFEIQAPRAVSSNYGFLLRGDSANAQWSANGFVAPLPNVLSCSLDIAGANLASEVVPRVNGATPTLVEVSAGPAGVGNFGNVPLNLGRRSGGVNPFNGRIYGLVIRGASTTDSQIVRAERWMNGKTGAY